MPVMEEGDAVQGVRRRRRLPDLSLDQRHGGDHPDRELIAPTFGGINLEDISAPRCFEIEERLKAKLDIPVFHDDQHGTAVVVMAAFFNSLKIIGKSIEGLRVLVLGTGAAGVATARR